MYDNSKSQGNSITELFKWLKAYQQGLINLEILIRQSQNEVLSRKHTQQTRAEYSNIGFSEAAAQKFNLFRGNHSSGSEIEIFDVDQKGDLGQVTESGLSRLEEIYDDHKLHCSDIIDEICISEPENVLEACIKIEISATILMSDSNVDTRYYTDLILNSTRYIRERMINGFGCAEITV